MKKTLLSILLFSTLNLQGCSTLSSLIEKPDSEKTVEEFYTAATEAFQDGQWDTATQNYEKLKAYFPYGEFAEQSYLELAYSYYKYDEPESAIRELEEFVRLYPKHPQLAYAYYLKALAADSVNKSWLDKYITDPATRDVKSTQRAFTFYNDVLARFPQTPYATQSAQRLIVLSNQMARHEVFVAEFYYNKQAYLAAANRAQSVIENYPRASSTHKALQIMEASYEKLGMTDNMLAVRMVQDLNQKGLEPMDVNNDNDDLTNPPKPENQKKSWWSSITSVFD
ncbi:outer membrane protein assembly factor BamD [Thiomicrorhabdus aquaedulcis]|uniref:outer membrane protein assembly factor BamD n=1 Tax=Thiomicrorhabdus aquaedulcis TaxID=2211106 RepID=UPI000FDC2B41|nr:outer membrane protein assembly factor BamD [Thiomicrorhabdus aquaedulcis]